VIRFQLRRNQRGGFGRFFGCGAAPLLQKVQLFIKNAELNACTANINTGKIENTGAEVQFAYRLSADTASEVRQMLNQKRR
jgi:hypothetical protein